MRGSKKQVSCQLVSRIIIACFLDSYQAHHNSNHTATTIICPIHNHPANHLHTLYAAETDNLLLEVFSRMGPDNDDELIYFPEWGISEQ